jgi:hypothetical protein
LKGEKREREGGREKFEILINSVKYPRENSLRQRKGKWRKTRSNKREQEEGQKGGRSVRKGREKWMKGRRRRENVGQNEIFIVLI